MAGLWEPHNRRRPIANTRCARWRNQPLPRESMCPEIPLLEFLDTCSPAATVGYAIGRIGCLLSGDGDYGVPTTLPWGMSFPNGVVPTTERVHPTPIYEFLIWLAIAAFLWRLGKKALRGNRPKGEVFCAYLILTGVARFLIEFIRVNPRSFFGLSNAQTASLVSIVVGIVLFWRISNSSAVQQNRPHRCAPLSANKEIQ